MACFPLALAFGITGIAADRSKVLAIIMTVVAGGCVLFYVCMIAISIVARA